MKDDSFIVIKGMSAGGIFGIMWQIYLMLNMLFSSSLVLFGVPIVTMLLLSSVLAHVKVKFIFLEILIGILPAILSAFFLLRLGIINWAYHLTMGEEMRMTAGDGFAIMVQTMVYLFFTLFAPFIAYVGGRRKIKIE